MTTQPQRDPAPQALSEAELKLALNDLHRHHPSVADKVAQHISTLQAQLEYAQGYKEGLEDVNQTLAKERDTAGAQLEQYKKSAPLCEKHQPTGGARAMCLVCACIELDTAIDEIDYQLGEPNEYHVGDYVVSKNTDSVIARAKALKAQLEQAQGERDTAVKVAKSLGQTKESLEDEIAAIKNLNIDLQRERDDLVAEIDVKRRRNEELYRELTASREQVRVLTEALRLACKTEQKRDRSYPLDAIGRPVYMLPYPDQFTVEEYIENYKREAQQALQAERSGEA